ncbi:MAG TPA: hypothetical protein VIV12_20730, partial [Streptosporangiaceae bacterium]
MMHARWFGRRGLTALAAPLLIAVVLTGAGPGRASASACVSWTGTQPPAPNSPPDYRFNGVAVLSRCNAWAVGSYSGPTSYQTLIDHWNGSEWKQVASPNPGSERNQLVAVAAVSASNAWAVGSYAPAGADQTLILHWNGTVWKHVASPSPAAPDNPSYLDGVAAVSSRNAWAVGSYYSPTAQANKTLILHWNGTAWKKMASPNPGAGSNVLNGVTAISASNAWAVGELWNSSGTAQTLVLHWNGIAWKKVASPNPGSIGNELNGVTAISGSNAWA